MYGQHSPDSGETGGELAKLVTRLHSCPFGEIEAGVRPDAVHQMRATAVLLRAHKATQDLERMLAGDAWQDNHGAVPPMALIALFAPMARSTNRSTHSMVITACQLQNVCRRQRGSDLQCADDAGRQWSCCLFDGA